MASLNMASSNVPGLLVEGNIDLTKRPVVKNPDGTISTVRSMSFQDSKGREVLIPTVSPDGRILSNREAMELYGKTGQHLGIFGTPQEATKYAETLHNQQEKMYASDEKQGGVTLNIEGKKVKVDRSFLNLSPEEQAATVEEIAGQLGIKGEQPAPDESDKAKALRSDLAKTTSDFMGKNDGLMQNVDSFMRGAADTTMFGLADEASAIGEATNPLNKEGFLDKAAAAIRLANPMTNMVQQAKELIAPSEETQRALRRQRAFQAQRDDADPIASNTGRVAGALTGAVGLTKAGAPYMGSLAADATLGAKVAQGAKAGALYSGLYGLGSGEGVEDRAVEAGKQALTGAVLGGALPVITAGVKAATKPVRDAISGYMRPEAYANQKIAERLADAGMTADQAAVKMARQPGLSLADVGGETTKNLLKTATNIPGPGAARVKTQLVLKQMQQGDRVKDVIKQTFADPDGYLTAKDDIAATAQRLAKPLYDKAYETPIPFTKSLEDILQTPAVKRALVKAEEKMANSQSEFRQMFANVADDGTVTIRRVPDTQGWDYIKRALDDEIGSALRSGAKDDARILTGLKQKILQEVDAANPYFAQARKIWSGQAALDDALEAGREAMKASPEATKRLLKDMSQAEKESFKIGVAEWLRGRIDGTGFTQNSLLKFFSNKGQLENLRAAFDDPKQFKAFRDAIFAEARKRSTYNIVTGNSSTAKQLADMAEAGGLRDTVDFASRAATQGPVSATLQFVGSRLKMLGGFNSRVADQVAKKLMASDPQTAQAITNELSRIENAAISADQKRQLVQKIITPMLAQQGGRLIEQ